MNALSLLKDDHQTIFQLFDRIKTNKNKNKYFSLCGAVKDKLEAHKHLEETVFYPSLKSIEELTDENIESFKTILAKENEDNEDLQSLLRDISDRRMGAKFEFRLRKTLRQIENHLLEEERVFVRLARILDEFQLEEIGAELEAERLDYQRFHVRGMNH